MDNRTDSAMQCRDNEEMQPHDNSMNDLHEEQSSNEPNRAVDPEELDTIEFGQFIARALSKMNGEKRLKAMQAIMDILNDPAYYEDDDDNVNETPVEAA